MKLHYHIFSCFLLALMTMLGCRPSATQRSSIQLDQELPEITIAELQSLYERDQVSIEKVVQWYTNRVKEVDQHENGYNSVIELNPDALAIAKELDDERRAGRSRGPLHGVPFMIKDNIETGDKMQTTAGSIALEGNYASYDAPIISQLREAGAVLIGKTNLSEWANFRNSPSTSGWSSLGGLTHNAFDTECNACGSSSGSAVAVSTNMCLIALGTETDGSIVCPSSVNGIVGMKPTVGLLSRTGIIPISHTQDSAGPMGRTVADVAAFLSAMTAKDAADEKTMVANRKVYEDYTQFLKADALEGKKLAVVQDFPFDEKTKARLQQAVELMKNAGAEVISIQVNENNQSLYKHYMPILQTEFKEGINDYLSSVPEQVRIHSLSELISFNQENSEQVMPHFGQNLLLGSQQREGTDSEEYKTANKLLHHQMRKKLDSIMNAQNIDAFIAPTTGPAWKTDLENGDRVSGSSSTLAAWTGYPIITVPMGQVDNLPVGISFFSSAWTEPTLLSIAYSYEQQSKHRLQPPTLQKQIQQNE